MTKKNNLEARIKNYETMLAGSTAAGRRVVGVNPSAFHKPGSNKK